MDLQSMGRLLLIFGIGMAILGGIIMLLGRLPFMGQLPGDISVQRGPVTFFFPLATMILLSIILTIVLNVIIRIVNR